MTRDHRSTDKRAALVRRHRATAALVATLLAAGITPAAAEMVTITAQRDNTLFQDATGSLSNGAGPAFFSGMNSQGLARRALLRFDVVASVPAGAVISNAVLTLNVSNVSDTAPRLFTLHWVQSDWGEGASSGTGGRGVPASPGDATWLHTFWPDALWSNSGGDFEPAASATQSVGDVGVYSWTGPQMTADVQAWRDQPATNFGWLLLGDETTFGTARRFDSHESTEAANRPTLTLTYGVPAGAPISSAADGAVLAPCHPNPGAREVRFAFSITTAAHVELIVSDVTGRRVATVLDRPLSPGPHEVGWAGLGVDGRSVEAGVYFYRLIVGGRALAPRHWTVLR